MKTKNIFLTLSLVAFVVGFSDPGESALWSVGLPVGAILFCLFMIFNLLEKETALLDDQNREAAAKRNPANGKVFSPALEKSTKPVYGSSASAIGKQIAI